MKLFLANTFNHSFSILIPPVDPNNGANIAIQLFLPLRDLQRQSCGSEKDFISKRGRL